MDTCDNGITASWAGFLAFSLVALLFLCISCTLHHGGTVLRRPSNAGMQVLKTLNFRTFRGEEGDLDGRYWWVCLIGNRTSGVLMEAYGPGEKRPSTLLPCLSGNGLWLYVETDGDVADLYTVVTGSRHPTLKGALSDAYRKSWTKELVGTPLPRPK